MGRYKPKGSKRIVNPQDEVPVEVVPKLKVCGKNAAEVAVAKNNTTLKDEEAERAEIRRKAGLTYEQLCETVAKGLMAMVCNAETGEPICPANSERAKFVAAAIDLLGAKKGEQGAQKIPSIMIILPNGLRL
jgi:hypothetical protein